MPNIKIETINKMFLPLLMVLLITISIYDLFSPPATRTIWRQTQTAMLTENYVRNNFSFNGLYVNMNGNEKLMTVYEFPLYNFVVGMLFLVFNNFNVLFGKIVSLLSSLISLFALYQVIGKLYGKQIALLSGLFFILSPLGMLMRTSFQPDAMALMFLLFAINYLYEWNIKDNEKSFVLFAICCLFASLIKIPIIIPYLPIIAAAIYYKKNKHKANNIIEALVIFTLLIIPIIGWYYYRIQLTAPIQKADEVAKFMIGDMSRFMSPDYYIKPAFTSMAFIFCGTGTIYLICGLWRLSIIELMLILGVPLYFILVPTIRDQYYYLYSIVPIYALLFARGFMVVYNYCKNNKMLFVSYTILTIYVICFVLSTMFVLTQDRVMLYAAEAVRKVSQPNDLILSINTHDRGIAIGSNNSSLFYLAQRKGWAIWGDYNIFNQIHEQIGIKNEKGAKWLVITWYTPDLEPWFSPYLPNNLRRDPGVNGKELYNYMKKRYKTVCIDNNYAVMQLK